MASRLSAFVIWALVGATAVFWSLRLVVRAPVAPPFVVAVGEGGAVRGDLTRLLGVTPVAVAATAPPPEAATRFRLLGVVAPKNAGAGGATGGGGGVALIAVDGKLPKAFAVGSSVDGDLTLQSVSLRTASIASGRGAVPITLELPALAAAATGSLPVGAGSVPVPVPGGVLGPMPSNVPPSFVMPPQPGSIGNPALQPPPGVAPTQ